MAGWKKNRMSFDDVSKKADAEKSNGFEKDARMWTCHREESGIGAATIRFLPPSEGEESPWVKLYSHGFEGQGWFIANCPTTLGKDQDCPVCEINREMVETNSPDSRWKMLPDRFKTIVRDRKRNLSYYTNILVIEDKAHPENEGKVFMYRFGVKVYAKIMDAISPEFADDVAINPFDYIEGANFRLKIRKVDGHANYDMCKFDNPSALFDGDEAKLDELYASQHLLAPLAAPDQFDKYEDLKKRLGKVLGQKTAPVDGEVVEEDESPWKKKDEEAEDEAPKKAAPKKAANKKKVEEAVEEVVEEVVEEASDEVENALAFFDGLEE